MSSVLPDGEIPPEVVAHLRAADPVLRGVVDRVGVLLPNYQPDLWWSLVDAIVSQQISIQAAATILGRLERLTAGSGPPTPGEILAASDEELRACGLSRAKLAYVRDLAAHWRDGALRPDRLPELPDDEVVAELTRVKGIGPWTAEMFLIFTLRRPDVLPVDDLGLRVAVQNAYGLPDRPGADELRRLAEPWRPFRSAATLYLWRSRRLP